MHRPNTTIAILIALIPALSISAPADDCVNLAPNPGFELADGGVPAFWEQRTPTDHERTLAWDSEVAHSGTRSLRIDNHGTVLSRWRYGHLRDFALEPGSRGELTVWIKCDGAKGSAHTKLYFLDAEGGIITQPQGNGISGTRDWTQTRQPFDVPENTAYVMIYLEVNGEGAAWFDDVVLTGAATRPSADMRLTRLTCGAENFDRRVGFVPRVHRRQPTVELPPGVAEGRVELVFHGESARYDVTVSCLDRADAGSRLRLLLAGKPVGEWSLAEAEKDDEGLLTKVVSGVDIQRGSRIVLEGRSDGGRCRIRDISFTPVGRFQGNLRSEEELGISPSLRIFDAFQERPRARGMLPSFISRRVGEAVERRNAELAALGSPDDWRKRQQATRERLGEIFGSYGPRTPLNARIVGKIDRPDCVIEKLIFESQPGYHCTANFYVPKNRQFPRPGVLFTCGHAVDGKAAKLYHECCLGLVAKGYVVLALDPTGQGERLEYFDWETGQPLVPPCVAHHHYLSRPSWLVDRSLAGYRTWDGTRAIDYLVDREEVDPEKIAVVGNSGGGIMALLITAFDERVKVCAAAHPGGSMEQTFLAGRRIAEADILSLIPPRPCLMVVGRDSGEEAGHRAKMANMFPFYEGLGVSADRCQMALVDGVHNMEQPKREPCYGWLNRWFEREVEGPEEPPLETETVEALRCTETGYTLRDLGGESGQTLNAKLAAQMRPPRAIPDDIALLERQREEVKAAVARRLGLNLPADRPAPEAISFGEYRGDGYSAKKLLVRSEDGIDMPSLLFTPAEAKPGSPVILYVSEYGKPVDAEQPSLALELVRQGHTVFAVDVRGSGETDPRMRDFLSPVTHYDAAQFQFDSCAVEAAQLNTTMLAMRAYDVVRSMDYLAGSEGLAGRPIVLVGEGLGGVWAMVTAAFDARAAGVVCVETVPSYKLIVDSRYYVVRDYYWVAGALADYDISDLPGLIAPRPILLLNPRDAMLEPLELSKSADLWQWPVGVYQRLGVSDRIRFVHTGDGGVQEQARQIGAAFAGPGMVGTFTGSPREIGAAFGRMNQEALRQAQTAWLGRAGKNDVTAEQLLDMVKPMVAVVREIAPHWIEEAEAAAEAAGIDPALHVAQMFYIGQASTGFRGWFVPEGEDECTSYTASPGFTEGNAAFFHRTRDNTPGRQTGAIWETKMPGVYKFLAVTYTGSRGPSVMVNDRGLAASADAVGPSATKRQDVGMMNGLMLRYIAEKAANCEEALEIIERFVENGWYAGGKPGTRWTLVDRHGTLLDVAHSSDQGSLTHRYRTGKSHVTVTRGGTADKMLENLDEPIRFTAFRNVSRKPEARIDQGRASIAGMTIRIHPEHPDVLTSAWFSFPAVSLAFPMYMGGTGTPLPLMDGSIYDLCAGMPHDYEAWQRMEETLYRDSLQLEAKVAALLAEGSREQARQLIDSWTQARAGAHLALLEEQRDRGQ